MTHAPEDLPPLPTSHRPASHSRRFSLTTGPRTNEPKAKEATMPHDLDLPVRAYRTAEQLTAGTPYWTGTLEAFWLDHPTDLDLVAIGVLAGQIKAHGSIGFASTKDGSYTWLVLGEAHVPAPPKGWAVAATSVEEKPAPEVELRAAFERLLDDVEEVFCDGFTVENENHPLHESVRAARRALGLPAGKSGDGS